MLDRLKAKPLYQIEVVAAATLLAETSRRLFDFNPVFRSGWLMILQGVAGGVFAGSVVLMLLILTSPFTHEALAARRALWQADDLTVPLGAGLTAAAGEELLLRGYLFAPLLTISAAAAYAVNFVVTALLYLGRRRSLPYVVIRGLEGTLYALLYATHRSLLLVAVAHFTAEVVTRVLFSQPRFWPAVETVVSYQLARLRNILRFTRFFGARHDHTAAG